MQDISVIYISRVTLYKDMGNLRHSHDYWHMSISFGGKRLSYKNELSEGFLCTCYPPNQMHSGFKAMDEQNSVNIMFHVNNKQLERKIRLFPFEKLTVERTRIDILTKIIDSAVLYKNTPEYIDAAFNFYMELLLCSNEDLAHKFIPEDDIVSKCIEYIEANYNRKLKVEEIAEYAKKTPNYVSSIFSTTMGITLIEYINKVKIQKACNKISYTEDDIEQISIECGFENYKNFCRVFKSIVGLTPSKYRTSHPTRDMRYFSDEPIPDVLYANPVFTYITAAKKCVYWNSPAEYLSQKKK